MRGAFGIGIEVLPREREREREEGSEGPKRGLNPAGEGVQSKGQRGGGRGSGRGSSKYGTTMETLMIQAQSDRSSHVRYLSYQKQGFPMMRMWVRFGRPPGNERKPWKM